MGHRTNRSRRRARHHQVPAGRRGAWPAWTTAWSEPWIAPLLIIGVVVSGGLAALVGVRVGLAGWIIAIVFAVLASGLVLWAISHWSQLTPRWRWIVVGALITLAAGTFGVSLGGRRRLPVPNASVETGPQLVAALSTAAVCLVVLSVVVWRQYGRPPKVHHAASAVVIAAERADHDAFQAVCRCGWMGPSHRIEQHADAEERAETDAELHLADVREPIDRASNDPIQR